MKKNKTAVDAGPGLIRKACELGLGDTNLARRSVEVALRNMIGRLGAKEGCRAFEGCLDELTLMVRSARVANKAALLRALVRQRLSAVETTGDAGSTRFRDDATKDRLAVAGAVLGSEE